MTKNILDRCAAVSFRSSRIVTALALAAGLSLLPLAGAQAQHGGHHGHHEQGARKAPAKKGSTKRAPARQRQSALDAHAGHGASASDTPAVAEFKTAHASMMRGMACRTPGMRTRTSASR